MSVQKIRLPSVNDIFPQPNVPVHHHQHHYPPNHAPMAPHAHTRQLMGIATATMQTGAPSSPHYNEVHNPMPVYYYQPVYYTHASPGTPPPPPPAPAHAMGPYSGAPSPVSNSPVHSPVYVPHQGAMAQQFAAQQLYVSVDIKKYRVQKHRQSNAWSDEDDTLLKYLKEVRNLGWREISMHFRNRTANGCQFRWRRISAFAKAIEKEKKLEEDSSVSSSAESSSDKSEKEDDKKDPEFKPAAATVHKRSSSLDKLLN